jgi:hypothetical protein
MFAVDININLWEWAITLHGRLLIPLGVLVWQSEVLGIKLHNLVN